MANVDSRLKTLFVGGVMWVILLALVGAWIYFAAQHRQARRELIFVKAQQQAQAEHRQRLVDYQKKLKERQLRREYNRRRVVDISGRPALPR